MGAHFDAVVVDCDNEQNATLLFKSARNSASNQASLAVAVVEGQAGVAKAFRIGANLVLTKPINIEQAKGTLRVARGLLRKGEPNKATAPAPSASAPATEAPVKPAMPPKPAAQPPAQPAKSATTTQSRPPLGSPTARPAWPTPAAPAVPVAASPSLHGQTHAQNENQDEEIPEIILEDSASTEPEAPAKIAPPIPPPPVAAAPALAKPSLASPKLPASGLPAATKLAPKMPSARPSAPVSSGAASAPAPAREMQPPQVTEAPAKTAPDTLSEKPAAEEKVAAASDATATQAPAVSGHMPTFTFGGANVPETGNKKTFLIVAALVVVVGAAAYFGWNYYQSRGDNLPSLSSKPAATAQPQPANPQPVAPKAVAPATTPTVPAAPPATRPAATASTTDTDTAPDAKPSAAPATTKPSTSTPSPKAASSAPAPLVVKSGTAPAVLGKVSTPEVSAPSVIGIGAGSSGELPPDIASSSAAAPKPLLQRLNISQGVSQGLLIKKVQPIYPSNGLSQGLQGEVQLMATISKTGNITSIKVLSGDPQLAHSATEAVKQWKYKPYLLNGEPVEIQTPITITFRLPR